MNPREARVLAPGSASSDTSGGQRRQTRFDSRMDWLSDLCGSRFAPLAEQESEQPLQAQSQAPSSPQEGADPVSIPVIDVTTDSEMDQPEDDPVSPAVEVPRLKELVRLLKAGPQSGDNVAFLRSLEAKLAAHARQELQGGSQPSGPCYAGENRRRDQPSDRQHSARSLPLC